MSLIDEIQLRPAVAADRTVIRKLVFSEHLNLMDLDWRRFLLAVTVSGEVVGCIQVKNHRDGTRELASLVVKPAWRGRGLARLMIETKRAGQVPPLYLMCRSTLEALYARFGFRPLKAGEMPGYYRRIHALFQIIRFFARESENLSIMKWE
jgi:amino-acid N-acetyltransferase